MVEPDALEADLFVFDFDGTLVDSNPIKWKAFETCFEGPAFAARREEIFAYCRGNNHTTRSEKFRFVYEKILRLPYTCEVEKQLHRRFGQETTEAIVQAPEIPGASKFLQKIRRKHRTAVLSSTPHSILLEILKRRRWSGYFDLKQGAPVNKANWLKELKTKGLSMNRVLFFGDSPEDEQAAEKAGCQFVGVRGSSQLKCLNGVPDFQSFL